MFLDEIPKAGENKKTNFNNLNLNIKDIKENANELVNAYIKKYEKLHDEK
jgi:hypothetical protein